MNDFTYYNPTKIEFGRGKENNIGEYISQAGIKKVLLVYGGGSIKKNGLYERIISSLHTNNIAYEELGGVVSNPVLSKVNEGIKIAKANGAEAVLAVGGGSVADSAKTIAAGASGGSFPNHLIEHSLSALHNVAHGAGLAVVIPAWMKWYKEQNKAQFKRFAKEIFNSDDENQSVIGLENWFSKIGAPVTLKEAGIPREGIEALATNASGTAKMWGLDALYPKEAIIKILEKA